MQTQTQCLLDMLSRMQVKQETSLYHTATAKLQWQSSTAIAWMRLSCRKRTRGTWLFPAIQVQSRNTVLCVSAAEEPRRGPPTTITPSRMPLTHVSPLAPVVKPRAQIPTPPGNSHW